MNKRSFKNNYKRLPLFTALFFLIAATFSCNEINNERKPERSFYYWKSVFNLTNFEINRLDSLGVQTIYLKFFDVDWEVTSNRAIPVAKLQVPNRQLLEKYQIIPTVFITNETIQKLDTSQTVLLAGDIYRLIMDICKTNHLVTVHEIQIDCDWSVSSAKKYFALLKIIKQLSNKNISATIRLHQIKFLTKSGVPPVDRGLLMCYNMGNLKNPASNNSIIESAELKKYTTDLSTYPLPLDVALPLFDWKVLFRNNIYSGILENMPEETFTNSFSIKNNGRTEILKDTLLGGYYLKKGDLLRTEESEISEVLATAREVNKHLKNTLGRVSLYHLDSITLIKYTTHELESIYNSFH